MTKKLVWYVADGQGYIPTLFDTKEAAERWARMLFPDESPSQRYARVYYREVMTAEDVAEM